MNTALVLGLLLFGSIALTAQALPLSLSESAGKRLYLSLIHISEPTRPY